MRLWSLDPKYLDRQGLLALWREALLAKKVLAGRTKGYKNHPQLDRFKAEKEGREALNYYLLGIWQEAGRRGYRFDQRKIGPLKSLKKRIKVNSGQLKYEWQHLLGKLVQRDEQRFSALKNIRQPKAHNLFEVIKGRIEKWEKIK